MARKKSEFLGAFGIVLEIWKAIVDAVLAKGGTDDDLRRVVTEKGLATKIAEVIMTSAKPVVQAVAAAVEQVVTTFKAVVEYIQPSYANLKAAFDWINSDYQQAKFEPIDQCKGVLRDTCEVAFQYIHMGRDTSTEAVLAEMDRLGLRPALYEELLAFAKQFPNEQRQFPIVALGSIWVDPSGYRDVACLSEGSDERDLSLNWCDDGWFDSYRFLAVSK